MQSNFEWKVDPYSKYKVEDKKLVNFTVKESKQEMILTETTLLEEVLYPFEIKRLPKIYLTIGVGSTRSDIYNQFPFGCDWYRCGYHYKNINDQPYVSHNRKTVHLPQSKKLKENSTLYVMLHKGSYLNNSTSSKISFFVKDETDEKPVYCFTFSELYFENSRLYGFVSASSDDCSIRLGTPITEVDQSILPSELKIFYDEMMPNTPYNEREYANVTYFNDDY